MADVGRPVMSNLHNSGDGYVDNTKRVSADPRRPTRIQAKAQAIIRYRDEVGPFRSVEELEEVKGIGPNTVKRNKARISVTYAKG